jgi:hypothetical protein
VTAQQQAAAQQHAQQQAQQHAQLHTQQAQMQLPQATRPTLQNQQAPIAEEAMISDPSPRTRDAAALMAAVAGKRENEFVQEPGVASSAAPAEGAAEDR